VGCSRIGCVVGTLAWCGAALAQPSPRDATTEPGGTAPQPIPDAAQLSLACNVLDVEISLDGNNVGITPLAKPIQSRVGDHELTLWRAGYRPIVRRISLRAGDNAVPCVLAVKRPHDDLVMTHLAVLTNPPGAHVYVDGQRFDGGLVPRGRHTLRVQKPGYDVWEKIIDIDGPTYSEDVDLMSPNDEVVAGHEEPEDVSGDIDDHTWAYVFGGAGIAVGAVATGVFYWNAQRYGEWEDEQQALDQAWSAGPPFGASLEERQRRNDGLLGDVETMDAIWAVTASTSFALLGVGAYLYFSGGSDLNSGIRATAHPKGGHVMWSTSW